MVNLKDVATNFAPTSAYDVLSMLVFNCGEEAVRAALDEIAAQQSVQRTAETCPECGGNLNGSACIHVGAV